MKLLSLFLSFLFLSIFSPRPLQCTDGSVTGIVIGSIGGAGAILFTIIRFGAVFCEMFAAIGLCIGAILRCSCCSGSDSCCDCCDCDCCNRDDDDVTTTSTPVVVESEMGTRRGSLTMEIQHPHSEHGHGDGTFLLIPSRVFTRRHGWTRVVVC